LVKGKAHLTNRPNPPGRPFAGVPVTPGHASPRSGPVVALDDAAFDLQAGSRFAVVDAHVALEDDEVLDRPTG